MTTALLPTSVKARAVASPRKKLWSVEEFHSVRATGVWDGLRTYLIRGEIWEQGEMNPRHANVLDLANEVLRPLFAVGYRVRIQTPVVLGNSSPFPDIAVVQGTIQDFTGRHPTTAALIVEVSDTSLFEDTTTKAEVYATGGILDYWVIDVENRLLLVFRDPAELPDGGKAYRTCLRLTSEESIAPLALPTAILRVADLFAG